MPGREEDFGNFCVNSAIIVTAYKCIHRWIHYSTLTSKYILERDCENNLNV